MKEKKWHVASLKPGREEGDEKRRGIPASQPWSFPPPSLPPPPTIIYNTPALLAFPFFL